MKKRKKKPAINLLRHTNYQVFNVKFEKQIHFKETNIKDPFLNVNMNPNKQMEKKIQIKDYLMSQKKVLNTELRKDISIHSICFCGQKLINMTARQQQ